MSEFTDYLIYSTTAATLPDLRREVMAVAGPATAIFPEAPDLAPDAAARRYAAREGARWVALMSGTQPARIAQNAARPVAEVIVLEDFASWRLIAHCPGRPTVTVYLGGEDGYAAGWFRANYRINPVVREAVAEGDVAPLAACLSVEPAVVRDVVRYDRAWDFLTVLGAPSMQMADQGLILPLDDLTLGEARFAWELWPDIVETEDK